MEFDKILKTYIENILKLQEEHQNTPLSLEELHRLHQELGLSSKELDFIDKKFQDYYHRGSGFFRYQDWDRAIQELEQALILKPLHIEVLFLLAESYSNRSRKKQSRRDHQKAIYYAERCLHADSRNERALYLLAQLRRGLQAKHSSQGLLRVLIVTLTGILLSVSVYLLWDLYMQNPQHPPEQTHLIPQKSSGLFIPVRLGDNRYSRGFRLEVENSYLEPSSQKSLYHIRACLVSAKFNLQQLQVKLLLIDQEGKNVLQENIELLSPEQPELFVGDALPFTWDIVLPEPADNSMKAELFIESLSKRNNPDDTDEARVLWVQKKNREKSEAHILIKERNQTILPQADAFEHELVLEFSNQGTEAISHLAIDLEWYDVFKRQVYSRQVDLVTKLDPMLSPGQRRRIQIKQPIPIKFDDYTIYKISRVVSN